VKKRIAPTSGQSRIGRPTRRGTGATLSFFVFSGQFMNKTLFLLFLSAITCLAE
jgi:hypothetical protein